MSQPKPAPAVPAAPGLTRVLFVAGTGRSGSTLVSNLLGSTPGLVSVGEARYLWERGIGEAALCGCGQPVPSCPFWTDVLARAYPGDGPDVTAIRRADRRLLRVRDLHRVLRPGFDVRRLGPEAVWYAGELSKVYRALSEATGGAVVVDSSKLVSYGFLLGQVAGVDLHVLHLVRDPRGVAYSWGKDRPRDDRGDGDARMGRESPLRSSMLWDVWNVAAERLWSSRPERYVRVRYEDLIADPAAALAPVLQMLGRSPDDLPVHDDGSVDLATSHTVAGNPARMTAGRTALDLDTDWTEAMRPAERRLVTATTAPLLGHYGYPVRSPSSPAAPAAARVFVEDMAGLQRVRARAARNVEWVRTQGLGRVLEEKEIDPVRTVPAALRKWGYRRSGAVRQGTAMPVYVVGVQRSGTNMLVRGLGMAPEVEVHNESDPKAFARYKLREDDVVESLVRQSRHSHVLFKPLCDSHRTPHLLDGIASGRHGRAVWAYRDVDGRVRSALAKFGDGNLQVLREFANGANVERWHVQGISDDSATLVRSFDYETMSAASGAALMWLIRNRLYFDLGLDGRDDVQLVSYNDFVARPAGVMRELCAFLDFPYSERLVQHVSPRPATYHDRLDIDPVVREQCDDLSARLAAAAARSAGTPA